MDDISWTDLDSYEQRTVAMLAEGASTDLCDRVALLTLRRIGLVRGARLTLAAEQNVVKSGSECVRSVRHRRQILYPGRSGHGALACEILHGLAPVNAERKIKTPTRAERIA